MKNLFRHLSGKLAIFMISALMVSLLAGCEVIEVSNMAAGADSRSSQQGPAAVVESETSDAPAELKLIEDDEDVAPAPGIDEKGFYTSKDDVALYIHTYNKLPSNFITKKQAEKLGWQGGGLDDYMYGGCIGGTYFGNYEGTLPEKKGREYHECDIDTMHSSRRGAKRIVYSNDGLIYYSDDHYESFELLYGEE